MSRATLTMNHTADAHTELRISEDGMLATLAVRMDRPIALNYEDVMAALNAHSIVYGVDHAFIRRCIQDHNANPGLEDREYIVARGTPPAPGQAGRVDVLVAPPPPVSIDDHGRADFRAVQRYVTVEKGQVLAKRIPATAGQPGIDVFGKEVAPPKPFDPPLDDGPNISYIPGSGEYIARIRGVFVHNGDAIDVNPVLIVTGNVGLESGNLNYDGHVRIGGTIERGSEAVASGDMEVGGGVESGTVRVGGSLYVKKGINTRQEGVVRVSGSLESIFIDNSALYVEGDVRVFKSITASHITTLGAVSLSASQSTLTGGEVIAFGGVAADIIGSRTETPTRLVIGEHQKNMQYYKVHLKQLEDVEKEHEKIRDDVAKIKNYITRMRGKIPVDKQAAFRAVYKRYKEHVDLRERLQAQIAELRESRYNQAEVRVIARQMIFPGVEIVYRDRVEKINAPQSRVILKFAPGLERPVMEAFKGK